MQPDDKKQQALKEKLLAKMGQVEAMASHAKATAGSLKEAADHHGQQAHYSLHDLAAQIRASGVGNAPEAETAYCKALMDRHRMRQTYELAAQDEQRFPDLVPHDKHMQKSLHRLHPEDVLSAYTWGEVQDGLSPPPADDFQPRLYDPKELLPREADRDKDPLKVEYFREKFSSRPPEEIDPVVLVRTEHGREILDGHHRALGAKEADRKCQAVEMSDSSFQRLRGEGFSDMDIAYAILALGGFWEAADKVRGQFDGRSVRRTGFMAFENMRRMQDAIID